jgi:hypothetical protein
VIWSQSHGLSKLLVELETDSAKQCQAQDLIDKTLEECKGFADSLLNQETAESDILRPTKEWNWMIKLEERNAELAGLMKGARAKPKGGRNCLFYSGESVCMSTPCSHKDNSNSLVNLYVVDRLLLRLDLVHSGLL